MKSQKEIKITTDYITLGQLLKLASIIDHGGEAKLFLASNKVLVNGEEDNRRGRKLYPDYLVVIGSETFAITK